MIIDWVRFGKVRKHTTYQVIPAFPENDVQFEFLIYLLSYLGVISLTLLYETEIRSSSWEEDKNFTGEPSAP